MKRWLNITFIILLGSFCAAEIVSAENKISFKGNLDIKNQTLNITTLWNEQSKVDVQLSKIEAYESLILLNLQGIKTPFLDFSSEIESSMTWKPQKGEPIFSGNVTSRYSLVNYHPVKDLQATFRVQDGKIWFSDFMFGRVTADGWIGIEPPYALNLNIRFSSINMDEFLDFWVRDRDFGTAGYVFGEGKITGDILKPYMKTRLETHNGYVKSLSYDSMILFFEGYFPDVNLYDSSVVQSDGSSYQIAGELNLRDKKRFKEQVRALAISPMIERSDAQSEWTIKKSGEDGGATSLKYLLRQDDDSGEETGILGVERSLHF